LARSANVLCLRSSAWRDVARRSLRRRYAHLDEM